MKNILFVAALVSIISPAADAMDRIFDCANRTISEIYSAIQQRRNQHNMYTLEGISPDTFCLVQRNGKLYIQTAREKWESQTLVTFEPYFDGIKLYTPLCIFGQDSSDIIANELISAFRKNVIVQHNT